MNDGVDPDDPWSLRPNHQQAPNGSGGKVSNSELVTVSMLQNDQDDGAWVPPELFDMLFQKQDDCDERERTYLFVDATLRTNATGLFDLDVIGLPTACLFNGEAAEDQMEVAPYLIDMTLILEEPTAFHRDFFKKHWGRGTGIFIKSVAPLDSIKRHFRKFTKLKMEEDGRWVFFRFWDPTIASVYLETIAQHSVRSAQWFGRGLITSIVVEQQAGKIARIFKPLNDGTARSNEPLGPVVLTPAELLPFKEATFEKELQKMATLLKRDFDANLKSYTVETMVRLLRPCVIRFMHRGFKRRENLHVIAAWETFFGPEFEAKDPDGRLQRICEMKGCEASRMRALKDRMAQFGTPKETA